MNQPDSVHRSEEETQLEGNTKVKQLTLRLPENLHRELKVTAAREGRTMGDVATELIRDYLEKQ